MTEKRNQGMDKEEKYIFDKCGKESPFNVPNGYFDHLNARIMDKIPEMVATKKPAMRISKTTHWLRIAAAAACFCGVISGAIAYFGHSDAGTSNCTAQSDKTEAASKSEYIDEALDYAMLDNNDIYAYVTDEVY